MHCEAFVVQNMSEDSHAKVDPGDQDLIDHLVKWEKRLWMRAVVALCCFGVLGNILNLLALTRRSLVARMGKMEKSATAGLVALALSDFFFCFLSLPNAVVDPEQNIWFSLDFSLYYQVYSMATINIFVVSSTWFTVVMAVSRYLAICHPLHARLIVDMKFAKASLISVFFGSIVLNIPRFWHLDIECTYLTEEQKMEYPSSKPKWYTLVNGELEHGSTGWRVYIITYFILAVLIPLITLAFCNVYLIRALHQSANMRKQFARRDNDSNDATRIVTLTLTVIVVAYLLLVAPSEIFTFVNQIIDKEIQSKKEHSIYNFIVVVFNILQVLNFSFNFVLYIVINAHFRRTIKDVFTCRKSESNGENSHYDSMTAQTTLPLTCINSKNNSTKTPNNITLDGSKKLLDKENHRCNV